MTLERLVGLGKITVEEIVVTPDAEFRARARGELRRFGTGVWGFNPKPE
jgi:hypothetical protein